LISFSERYSAAVIYSPLMPLESIINILCRIINNTNNTYLALYVINHDDLNDNKLRERAAYVRVMAVMIQEEGGGAGPSGLARLNIHRIMYVYTSVYNIGTICVY